MNQMNDTVVELTAEEMKTVVGGNGSCIDPLGGTSTGGNPGEGGGCIDPNG